MRKSYRVVILGGGAGGISLAARLRKKMAACAIALVEPSEDHYYQPLWTLVGAGLLKKEKTHRTQRSVIPRGVVWIQDSVARVNPDGRIVQLKGGDELRYDALVVATGLQLDFHKIEGLEGNLGSQGIHSIYQYDGAEKMARALEAFTGGEAIFTMPPVPIKCAGAPQKIAYLADDVLRRRGVRDNTRLSFVVAGKVIFGVPEFAAPLTEVVRRKGIHITFGQKLVAVDAAAKTATFEISGEAGTRRETRPYDLLHVVPPMSAHAYVRESGLAFSEGPHQGWLEVDRHTLQHPRYPTVFGIGDVTGIPNSKTGAAVRKQTPVVLANLLAALEGKPLPASYDGYSSCPLVTGVGKVILAEFGYDGKLLPTFPVDPTRERWSMWILKRHLLSRLYWHGMLPGRL